MPFNISTTKFLKSQLFTDLPFPSRSFAGETVIITGSNTGLGKEAARHVSRLGAAKIILAVRNVEAGAAAKAEIEASTERNKGDENVIEVWKLDLASYESVKAFAARASSELDRIDVLLCNAALATNTYRAAEGHEITLTVNVISTFLLALLMLPKLKASAASATATPPRLTIVSSEAHAMAAWPERKAAVNGRSLFDAMDDAKTADMNDRYNLSKLLEILVIRQLAPKLAASGVVLNTLNPGFCKTELARELTGPLVWVLRAMKLGLARSTEVGSRTLMAAIEAGPESHGKYMNDCKVEDEGLSVYARSPEADADGKRVWEELGVILEKIAPGVTDNI